MTSTSLRLKDPDPPSDAPDGFGDRNDKLAIK
jgi:hypothetical protein